MKRFSLTTEYYDYNGYYGIYYKDFYTLPLALLFYYFAKKKDNSLIKLYDKKRNKIVKKFAKDI